MVEYTITTKTIIVGKEPYKVRVSQFRSDSYNWCTNMFGPSDYEGRWCCYSSQSTASVVDRSARNDWEYHFNNEEDAILFKLRWA